MSKKQLYPELLELIRFATVGVIVAAVYFVLFVLLSQAKISGFLVNAISFGFAVSIQYALQSRWTFKKGMANRIQAGRFIVTIGVGFLISVVISGLIGPILGWSASVTAAIVVLTLPISNYIFFKLWVFTHRN